MDHRYYMLKLIEYTKNNSKFIPYGASLVDSQGNVLIEAIGDCSECPVLHAEVAAILFACQKYKNLKWSELTLYSTGEPCAMCAAAACWANVGTIVYGTDISYMKQLWGEGIEGSLRCRDVIKTFPKCPQLLESICKEECDQMFLSYKAAFYEFWNTKRWEIQESI